MRLVNPDPGTETAGVSTGDAADAELGIRPVLSRILTGGSGSASGVGAGEALLILC